MRSAWILRGPREDPRDASLVAPGPVDVHSIGGIPVLQPYLPMWNSWSAIRPTRVASARRA